MARLHLTVEGPTELEFAAQVLRPHLVAHQVYLGRIELAAHKREKREEHRGGLQRYEPFRNDIGRRLKEDRNVDVFLSTMIDLHKLPRDFPESEAARTERDPYRRVERLELALAADIGDRRFIPYIQLHEFEAVLFAKPDAILTYYSDRNREVAALNQLVARDGPPELIDDGENTAPSKRIIAQIPEYGKSKRTAGPIIAATIGLPTIRAKCPHFDAWLRQLEQLGQKCDQGAA